MCSLQGGSFSFVVDGVPEGNDGLGPGWVVPGDDLHGVDLGKLHYVEDLELLELEESVEDSVVELPEESQRVSA